VLPAIGRRDDFAAFMVPRTPGVGGRVCMSYQKSGLGTLNRIAYMRRLHESDPGPGVRGYVDGEVVG
jgi:hypothetical protein